MALLRPSELARIWELHPKTVYLWIREGKLQYVEEVLDGIAHAPDAIAGLYRGENLGKRLIRL